MARVVQSTGVQFDGVALDRGALEVAVSYRLPTPRPSPHAPRHSTPLLAWLAALLGLCLALATWLLAPPLLGSPPTGEPDCDDTAGLCDVPLDGDEDVAADAPPATLLFFWGVGCPHCEEAKPTLDRLASEHPGLRVERIEVRESEAGRQRFLAIVAALDIAAPGIPTFVYGDHYLVGYQPGHTEAALGKLLEGEAPGASTIELPWLGSLDARAIPLPLFTLTVGLVDGVNPCAMWVLLVLMSILVHVDDRRRLLLFGGVFVVMSGVVYFLFMTVWVSLFRLVGLSRSITIGLGVVVLVMGLINLKELIWFKRGVSLMIPDEAKPKLYKRMRGIARAASLPAAIAGIVVLAFLVNLIELGCTLGLPAVYTRILSLRTDVGVAGRYGYLALYNLAYVVPLALIVLTYTVTLHRYTLSERGAKVLKGVSGVLLVLFGLLFIAAPGLVG